MKIINYEIYFIIHFKIFYPGEPLKGKKGFPIPRIKRLTGPTLKV